MMNGQKCTSAINQSLLLSLQKLRINGFALLSPAHFNTLPLYSLILIISMQDLLLGHFFPAGVDGGRAEGQACADPGAPSAPVIILFIIMLLEIH